MGRLQSIQVLRFFAALAVVHDHLTIYSGHPQGSIGAAGVDVFFVLSGFVIGRVAAERPRHFLQDRLTRIFPIYWVVALPWTVWALGRGQWDAGRMFTTVTLWPVVGRDFWQAYLPVSWTLSFELLFYLATWAALRGVAWRRIGLAYLACLALAFASRAALFLFLGSPIILEFGLGLVLSRLPRLGSPVGAVALALGLIALLPQSPKIALLQTAFAPLLGLGRVFACGAPAAAIVFGLLQFELKSPAWRPLAFLGDASYALYLSHLGIVMAASRYLTSPLRVALAGGACVLAAAVLHRWVERPLLSAVRARASLIRARWFPQAQAATT